MLLPVLSGVLLAVSFPRIGHGYLAWVAYIPLIAFVYKSKNAGHAFLGGFVAGAIEIFLLMIWIPGVMLRYGGLSTALAWLAFGLMIGMLACFPAAGCAISKYLTKRGGEFFFLLFPAVWIVQEYAQTLFPFGGLPWLLAGYSQSDYLSMIQIADIAGVFGISFIILWTGAAIVWLAFHNGSKRSKCAPLIVAVLLIAACLVYGRIALNRWDNIESPFGAAMLQGNISFDDTESVLAEKFQRGYVKMADKLNSAETDLLILPESPSPISFQYDPSYRRTLEDLARRYSLGLIFNNIRMEETKEGTRYFNSAYFLDGRGVQTGIYDKIHLVPFGEYIPLEKLFFFAETITRDVGAFQSGKDYKVINIGGKPANAIICFEAVFPDLVRRFVRQGSRLIINLTNDAWYGDSAAPYQHFAIARFRAVENRRFLIRAANSGISGIIDPGGRVQGATGLLQEAISRGRFAFLDVKTVYTRYGDAFVFLCAIISCALWIAAGFRRASQPDNSGIGRRAGK